jgi:hypothetical protein
VPVVVCVRVDVELERAKDLPPSGKLVDCCTAVALELLDVTVVDCTEAGLVVVDADVPAAKGGLPVVVHVVVVVVAVAVAVTCKLVVI